MGIAFIHKGINCVDYGLKAEYYWIEKHRISNSEFSVHANLYGIDKNGEEVLFTKDHIHPKSKGGKDHIDNYQTMCSPCNCRKGSK